MRASLNVPTRTGGDASGTWGINITGSSGSCSGNSATASSAATLSGVTINKIFNNMGGNHNSRTDFNAIPDAGAYYVMGSTNGPGVNGASQYYGFTLGLGSDYSPVANQSAKYGTQIYWGRNVSNPYINIRYLENGSWGSWQKASAGYADSAGNADTVDGLHAGSFLRSDADDTVNAGVTYSWAATDTHGLQFRNSSYSSYYLYIGGWTSSNDNNISRIRNSSGNLHIDSAANGNLYLNWYTGGSVEVGSTMNLNGSMTVDGNTNLGNGNGDWTHVNDVLYLGATDSGDSHFYFGENSSGWYGEHWYWDSGYTTNRYSRHAGTDTLIEKHDTRYTHKIQTNRAYERLGHSTGYQIGSYNSVGGNSTNTNPIYVIGDSYRPSDTSLGNMYGIGYSHGNFTSILTGGWGMYVASDGDARIGLNAEHGHIKCTGYVDAGGHMKNNNPCFHARSNVARGVGVYIFNVQELDSHNAYNHTNGRFTAPIAGRYVFTVWAISHPHNYMLLEIRKNGSRVYNASPYTSTQLSTVTGTIVINLAVNDYVDVRIGIGTAYGGGNDHNGFCGYMIG